MPRSSACLIIERLWSSGRLQVWLPRSGRPNDMQPRQRRDTSRPVEPSLVYSMRALYRGSADRLLSGRDERTVPVGRWWGIVQRAAAPGEHGGRAIAVERGEE